MNTDTNTTVGADTTINKWGVTLDGRPKKSPGRKPGSGNSITMKTIYILDGVVQKNGRPSLDCLRRRTFLSLPKNTVYDPAIHGVGVRPATDDARVKDMETRQARKNAAKATPAPAPAGPSVAQNAVNQSITMPATPAPAKVEESETVSL